MEFPMPEKKTEKKKTSDKKPLDMTTDEAIEFLFGEEGAQTLKNYVREKVNPPPKGDGDGGKSKGKSARKQGNI
jgi:hypothetical protein